MTLSAQGVERLKRFSAGLCLAKTRSTCQMNDIPGGRVTSYMDDIIAFWSTGWRNNNSPETPNSRFFA